MSKITTRSSKKNPNVFFCESLDTSEKLLPHSVVQGKKRSRKIRKSPELIDKQKTPHEKRTSISKTRKNLGGKNIPKGVKLNPIVSLNKNIKDDTSLSTKKNLKTVTFQKIGNKENVLQSIPSVFQQNKNIENDDEISFHILSDCTEPSCSTKNKDENKRLTFELEKSTVLLDEEAFPSFFAENTVNNTSNDKSSHENSTFELKEPTLPGTPVIKFPNLKNNTKLNNTSTPFPIKNSISSKKKNSLKPISSKQKSSVKKVPNFALIHKKVFQRMESCEEYLQRKKERAEMLLSNSKSNNTQNNKSKKQLQFKVTESPKKNAFDIKPMSVNNDLKQFKSIESPQEMKIQEDKRTFENNSKRLQFETVESSEKFEEKVKYTLAVESSQKVHKSKDKSDLKTNSKQLDFEAVKITVNPLENKTLSLNNINVPLNTSKHNLSNSFIKKKKLISKSTAVLPRKKEIALNEIKSLSLDNINANLKNSKSNDLLTKIENLRTKGYSRYGFKIVTNSKSNIENEKKSVANKIKVTKNDVNNRREIIKGVRTNRRFELLMKLRNN